MTGIPVHLVNEGIDWPAWVQAVGSIAAVAATGLILLIDRHLKERSDLEARLTVDVTNTQASLVYPPAVWEVKLAFLPSDHSQRLWARVKTKTSVLVAENVDASKTARTVRVELRPRVRGTKPLSGAFFIRAGHSTQPLTVEVTIHRDGDGKVICRRRWPAAPA